MALTDQLNLMSAKRPAPRAPVKAPIKNPGKPVKPPKAKPGSPVSSVGNGLTNPVPSDETDHPAGMVIPGQVPARLNNAVTQTEQIRNPVEAQYTVVGSPTNVAGTQVGPAAQAQNTQLDLTNDNQFRGNQQQLISQLQAQANGQGPSVAQMQFQQAANQNIAQQSALAASQRGAASGLAGRQAMLNSAGINQNLAGQSAIQRLQEQQGAQQQLAGVIDQGRSQDIGVANQNAQLLQGNQQFNTAAQNQLIGQQGNINANAALANAQAGNTNSTLQAQLNQQTSQANAGAINQANIAQGQIYGQNRNAATSASGQVAAAGAAAGGIIGAANINAGSANYIAQLHGILGMDGGSPGAVQAF